jgi:hypothetical protein
MVVNAGKQLKWCFQKGMSILIWMTCMEQTETDVRLVSMLNEKAMGFTLALNQGRLVYQYVDRTSKHGATQPI